MGATVPRGLRRRMGAGAACAALVSALALGSAAPPADASAAKARAANVRLAMAAQQAAETLIRVTIDIRQNAQRNIIRNIRG